MHCSAHALFSTWIISAACGSTSIIARKTWIAFTSGYPSHLAWKSLRSALSPGIKPYVSFPFVEELGPGAL
ncbi:hypothetical protein B0H11DRAFT_2096484 [Mycena galericulata]|nr:hypothetical protein B0H11DRAFT_2096484 [Mycena galericulata]